MDTSFDFDELYKFEQEQYLNEKEKSYKEIKPRKLTEKESDEILKKNIELLKEILGDNEENKEC